MGLLHVSYLTQGSLSINYSERHLYGQYYVIILFKITSYVVGCKICLTNKTRNKVANDLFHQKNLIS